MKKSSLFFSILIIGMSFNSLVSAKQIQDEVSQFSRIKGTLIRDYSEEKSKSFISPKIKDLESDKSQIQGSMKNLLENYFYKQNDFKEDYNRFLKENNIKIISINTDIDKLRQGYCSLLKSRMNTGVYSILFSFKTCYALLEMKVSEIYKGFVK